MSRFAAVEQAGMLPTDGPVEFSPAHSISGASPPGWTELIEAGEWDVYRSAILAVRQAGVRFMLGGAFGLATYTGRWRNTKDLDFFVRPQDRDAAIQALISAGFTDYYETLPYDRGWIYRATRNSMIVDIIWATPNRRTEVDDQWLRNARPLQLRDEQLEAIPAEELLWIKLYVVQRDRCDWPDLINLLYATSASLNWDRVVERLADDLPLLQGMLVLFAWICPDRIANIPANLRKASGIRKPRTRPSGPNLRRISLIDSRPWFAAFQSPNEPMRI